MLVGFRVTAVKAGGVTVTAAVFVTLAYVAEIVTGVADDTAELVTWNVTVVVPDGTVTDWGTAAMALLALDKATTAPAEGAFPSRLTRFAVLLPPPTILAGETVTELSAAGRTVSTADWLTPP